MICVPDNAKIDGWAFDCETTADGFEKALAVREFPYSNRPQVENLGQKARVVRVRAIFTGARYADHERLEALASATAPVVFAHPKYGELTGWVRTVNTNHDPETPDTAVCDIEFVVSDYGVTLPAFRLDVLTTVETAVSSGLVAAGDAVSAAVIGALDAQAAAVLGATLDPDLAVAGQITGLAGAARALVRTAGDAVAVAEAKLTDVTIPASSLISTIDFTTDLPGRVIKAFAQCAERYVTALATLVDAPDRLIRSLSASFADLSDAIFPIGDDGTGLYPAFLASTSLVAALAVAKGFDADQETRNANAALAGAESFDAAGNFVKAESPADVLSAPRCETALAGARTLLQAAFEADRANRALADVAAALLAHVSSVKLEMENLAAVEVEHETPLFLVLLANGLGYQEADRVLAVNSAIAEPNFVIGEVQIYVR